MVDERRKKARSKWDDQAIDVAFTVLRGKVQALELEVAELRHKVIRLSGSAVPK